MNLELLESFGQNYPEEFDGALDCISLAVTCSFNKRGTLLAVGCNDGRIVIWDFLTRGIAKIISAHVHPVCSLSWSRDGYKLLSASTDNNVCIWEILSGECTQKYRFPSPILKVQFHPRNDKMFLVCPMRHAAVLVEVEGEHQIVPLDEDNDLNIVASFDRRGGYIYTGNSKGKVCIYQTTDLSLKSSFKVMLGTASTTSIKSIEFARRGECYTGISCVQCCNVPKSYVKEGFHITDFTSMTWSAICAMIPVNLIMAHAWTALKRICGEEAQRCFLVNTADRVIRVYNGTEVIACGKDGEPEPVQKLQDLVNKTTWKKCCFSGDGEYICAGSARQHALYIWEKATGVLMKILSGTKGEVLLDVVWHPVRPIITSISSGVVSVWAQNQVENWSAFAPDFKELDENVEYEEKESEFDIDDEDKSVEAGPTQEDEDLEVDVCTREKVAAFCSSDEDEEDMHSLQFLPIAPEVEDPEDGWQATGVPDNSVEKEKERESKENTSPPVKKKKYKSYDVKLEGPPCEETHPLLVQWRSKEKTSTGKKPLKPRSEKRPNK